MKNKIIVILCLFTILNFNDLAYGIGENWFDKISRIKLGVSTKEDVESLFDSAKEYRTNKFSESEDVYYETKEGRLRVSYSLGTCSDVSKEFNLEKGKVVGYSFSSFEPIKFFKLKLNFESFEKQKESDTDNWYYFDRDSGIMYGVHDKKRLTLVVGNLTNEQIEKYSCKSK